MHAFSTSASRRSVLGLLAAAPIALAARPSFASARLDVVATTSMLADMLENVGGERVQVRALMGPGVDPHSYRQTRTDIAAMLSADLAVWHGLYLEAQMEEFMLELGRRKPARRWRSRCRRTSCAATPTTRAATIRTSGWRPSSGAASFPPPWRR